MNAHLGSLVADDIGLTLSLEDGGSVHKGRLCNIQHDAGYGSGLQTLVVLRAGEWRHCKTYPSDTPCTLEPAEVDQ